MASILGLEEQKAALDRVKDNLKKISKINANLEHLKEYLEQASAKEYRLECRFDLPTGESKRISVPVKMDDSSFVVNALKEHKSEIVKQIQTDASKFRIALSEQEEASLYGDKNAES